jgi:hypothetical protein
MTATNKGRERLRKSLRGVFTKKTEEDMSITAPQEESPEKKSKKKRYYIMQRTKKVGSR